MSILFNNYHRNNKAQQKSIDVNKKTDLRTIKKNERQKQRHLNLLIYGNITKKIIYLYVLTNVNIIQKAQ